MKIDLDINNQSIYIVNHFCIFYFFQDEGMIESHRLDSMVV